MENGHGHESGVCTVKWDSRKETGAIIRGNRCLAGATVLDSL